MSVWQDYAMMVIQFGLAGALVPAMFRPDKPDRWTCASTGLLLYCMSVVLWTLDLWVSSASAALVGGCWSVILIQRRSA